MMQKRYRHNSGFTLLEIMPVISIVLVLVVIATTALRPVFNFQKARNQVRLGDLGLISDAVISHVQDEGNSILSLVPRTPESIEICSDVRTGSCTGLLSLTPLLGTYLHGVPQDPSIDDDDDDFAEHSGYFVEMTPEGRFRFFAPNTEPSGSDPMETVR